MNRQNFLILLAIIVSGPLFAQNDVDALRYSMMQYGTTARVLGSGGAFGAMGGDFGSLAINPAGIGVYRSSELAISPGFELMKNNTSLYGSSSLTSGGAANLGHASAVFSGKGKARKLSSKFRLINTTFGIGMNRTASYQRQYEYSGFNPDNSMLDSYLEFLNNGDGTNPSAVFNADPFGAGLAYETYLVNPALDSNYYFSEIPSGGITQSKVFSSTGSTNEFTMAFGANFGHKLYVGGALGIPSIRYSEENRWKEEDTEAQLDLDYYNYVSRLATTGTGVNMKLGVIYKPHQLLRLGASVHTPTRYTLRDTYSATMYSEFDNGDSYSYSSPTGRFNYRLSTPWRVIGSMGIMLKEHGFISVDYEFVDYGFANYAFRNSTEQSAEDRANNLIEDKYRATGNLRAGAEIRADKWRFRGGYSYTSTPFRDGRAVGENDFSQQSFSGGLGYRGEKFYIDAAYVHRISEEYDIQYNLADESQIVQGAEIDRTHANVVVTAGFRF